MAEALITREVNYPHGGGCGHCRREDLCNMCGVALLGDGCTAGRCRQCHDECRIASLAASRRARIPRNG